MNSTITHLGRIEMQQVADLQPFEQYVQNLSKKKTVTVSTIHN